MSDQGKPKLVLSFEPTPALRAAYLAQAGIANAFAGAQPGPFEMALKQHIAEAAPGTALAGTAAAAFSVLGCPSNDLRQEGEAGTPAASLPRLVVALDMADQAAAAALLATHQDIFGPSASLGADLAISALEEHWCPGEAADPIFGDRAAAHRLLRAEGALPGSAPVTVIMVDTGLPKEILPKPPGFRGWEVGNASNPGAPLRRPGEPLTPHGAMVARNVRALLPKARLLDCPLIPDGITDLKLFLSTAVAAFEQLEKTIRDVRATEAPGEASAWIICNAWGVFDPSAESAAGPGLSYTRNPRHPLAQALRRLNALKVDIVFAAGNCGRHCPNRRCHPDFTGPGRSIHGANAHPDVLTVGAVRSDALWLGYAAEGPGPVALSHSKPDLAAPSHFAESDDARRINTGTSAACGVAAGAVALLRSHQGPDALPPESLRDLLRAKAWQPDGAPGWKPRTGFGILDLQASLSALESV